MWIGCIRTRALSSALTSVLTLLVWVLYFQLLYSN